MDCVIPGSNIRPFAKAIHTLSRLGDEVYFEAKQTCLVLSVVNFENTEHGSFKVLLSFFTEYVLHPPVAEKQTPNDAIGVKLKAKPLSRAFKSGNISERRLESCSISLASNPSKMKIIFIYKNKVTRMVHIWLIEGDEVLQVKPISSLESNKIVACSSFLTAALSNFRRSDPEITFITAPDEMIVQNYLEDDEIRYNAVRTQLTLDPKKFAVYKILCNATVTFSSRAFRAIVQFANSMHREVTIIFKTTGSPLEVHIGNSNTFEARFILATLQESDSQSDTSDASSMDLYIPYYAPVKRPEPNNELVPVKIPEANIELPMEPISNSKRLSQQSSDSELPSLPTPDVILLREQNKDSEPIVVDETPFEDIIKYSGPSKVSKVNEDKFVAGKRIPDSEPVVVDETPFEDILKYPGPSKVSKVNEDKFVAGKRISDSEPVVVDETPFEDILKYPGPSKVSKINEDKFVAGKRISDSEPVVVDETSIEVIRQYPGPSKGPKVDAKEVVEKSQTLDNELNVEEDTPFGLHPVFASRFKVPKVDTKEVVEKSQTLDNELNEGEDTPFGIHPLFASRFKVPKVNAKKVVEKIQTLDNELNVGEDTPFGLHPLFASRFKVPKVDTIEVVEKSQTLDNELNVEEDTPFGIHPLFANRFKVPKVDAKEVVEKNETLDNELNEGEDTPFGIHPLFASRLKVPKADTKKVVEKSRISASKPAVVKDTSLEFMKRYARMCNAVNMDTLKVVMKKQILPSEPVVVDDTPVEDIQRYADPCKADTRQLLTEKVNPDSLLTEQNNDNSPDVIEATPPEDLAPCVIAKRKVKTNKRPANDSPETSQQKRIRFLFQRCWDTTYKGLVPSDEEILAEDSDPECEALTE